jgi:hypothetical protein
MEPCPPLKSFIESITTDHGISILFPGSRLVLEKEGGYTLMIECVAPNRVILAQRYVDSVGVVSCPLVVLWTGAPQWLPLGLHSEHDCTYAAEISEDGIRLESIREVLQSDIARIDYDWAESLSDGSWDHAICVSKDAGDGAVAEMSVRTLLNLLGFPEETR